MTCVPRIATVTCVSVKLRQFIHKPAIFIVNLSLSIYKYDCKVVKCITCILQTFKQLSTILQISTTFKSKMSNPSYYQNYDKRADNLEKEKAKVEEQNKQMKQREAEAARAKESNYWLNSSSSSSNSGGGWMGNNQVNCFVLKLFVKHAFLLCEIVFIIFFIFRAAVTAGMVANENSTK
jgi:hypothetical protein